MIIRHLASSVSGPIVAAGEFERTVHLWDLDTQTRLATIDTILDFGGHRVAVTADGKHCIAASYRSGIASYPATADNARPAWHRNDLRKVQHVRVSRDDCRVYCCLEEKPCHILDRESGETIEKWPAVRKVWESPYQPIFMLDMKILALQRGNGEKVATIPRESFAALSVAFAPDLVCVSESGGPIRCLTVPSGLELWRYTRPNEHFLEVAYDELGKAFVGVCWPYEHGGSYKLFRFETIKGVPTLLSELETCPERAFCLRGSRLLLSDGAVLESGSGRRVGQLAFTTG